MKQGFPIAAATAALVDRLLALVGGDALSGAQVLTLNPGDPALRGGGPIVNLYLYRTTRNGAMSNADLPTRGADGRPRQTPSLMLTLDYMISFFGDEARLDPQRLLGLVAAGLWAWPTLDPVAVRAAIAVTPWLAGTAPGAMPLRISAANFSPEETARIWSEFVHGPYQLTQFYTVMSVALPEPVPLVPTLPVRRLGVRARPFGTPRVDAIVNADDPALPLVAGGRMAVRLANAAQPGLTVTLGGEPALGVTAGFDADGVAALLVPLDRSQRGVAAGEIAVGVIRDDDRGRVETAREIMTVLPALAGAAAVDNDRTLTAQLVLPAPASAAAAVLLNPLGDHGVATRLDGLVRADTATAIDADLGSTPAGTYLIRIELDGLVSPLKYDGDGFTGPLVTVPPAP